MSSITGFKEERCEACANLLEGVQVDVDGNLCSELVRKVLQHLPLIHCFLIGPQEVKPLDHPLLQVLSYLEGGGRQVGGESGGSVLQKFYFEKLQCNASRCVLPSAQ